MAAPATSPSSLSLLTCSPSRLLLFSICGICPGMWRAVAWREGQAPCPMLPLTYSFSPQTIWQHGDDGRLFWDHSPLLPSGGMQADTALEEEAWPSAWWRGCLGRRGRSILGVAGRQLCCLYTIFLDSSRRHPAGRRHACACLPEKRTSRLQKLPAGGGWIGCLPTPALPYSLKNRHMPHACLRPAC